MISVEEVPRRLSDEWSVKNWKTRMFEEAPQEITENIGFQDWNEHKEVQRKRALFAHFFSPEKKV